MVERYFEALKGVKDPEIPVLNIVEMGMVLGLEAEGDRVRVRFRPTFSGCPALALIREEIRRALEEAGAKEVEVVEERTPWTTEPMTEEAKEKLRAYGVAPPLPLPMAHQDPPCPRCGSRRVALKNPFGATLCKMLYQCQACGEVFEAFKTV
ncbi:putative 1,2-phenylacetyl-CoA epoxidase, subunit D [Thermus aquaticus]|uniref:Putative 1,2-phenylacetyl-CoA epoxidase, subunit D n=1 Tax=Thermus aquaticus TaxID=271 RepID=A0A0M9AG05_THEAQ|nr:1,2-phenylacetyl-CoA epoxidase subunit PaaD [Thermus aquaticus]KOX90658.1 putative 1,2-phenylacetyl-CoA epoxidase, subunit D [Thermus aquaticus]